MKLQQFLYLSVGVLGWRPVSIPESLVLNQSFMTRLLVVKGVLGPQQLFMALDFTSVKSSVFNGDTALAFVESYEYTSSLTFSAGELFRDPLVGSVCRQAADTLQLGRTCEWPGYRFDLIESIPPAAGVPNDVPVVLGCAPGSELGENSLILIEATEIGYKLRVLPGSSNSEVFEEFLNSEESAPAFYAVRANMQVHGGRDWDPSVASGWILNIPYLQRYKGDDGEEISKRFDTLIDFTEEGVLVHEGIAQSFIDAVLDPDIPRGVMDKSTLWVACESDEISTRQNYIRLQLGELQGIPLPLYVAASLALKPRSITLKNKQTGEEITRKMCQTVIKLTKDPKYQKLVVMGRMLLTISDTISMSGRESEILFKLPRESVIRVKPAPPTVPFYIGGVRQKGPRMDWLPMEIYVPSYDFPRAILRNKGGVGYTEVRFAKDFHGEGHWVLLRPPIFEDPDDVFHSERIRFIRNPRAKPLLVGGPSATGAGLEIEGNYCWDPTKIQYELTTLMVNLFLPVVGESCVLSTVRIAWSATLLELIITPKMTTDIPIPMIDRVNSDDRYSDGANTPINPMSPVIRRPTAMRPDRRPPSQDDTDAFNRRNKKPRPNSTNSL